MPFTGVRAWVARVRRRRIERDRIFFIVLVFRVVLLIRFIKDYYWMVRDWTLLNLFFDKLRCTSANEQALCFRFAVILTSC